MPLGEAERDLDRRALASERTALAWGRTALALAALGGVVVHAAVQLGVDLLGYGLGALLVGAAGVIGVQGIRRYRAIQSGALSHWQVDPRATRAIAAATMSFALASALLTILR